MHHVTTQWTFILVVGIILIGAVGYFAGKIGVAAPLLLVVAGAVLSLIPVVPDFSVSPEVILTVLLPPLLYSAARKVPAVDFRRNLRVIVFLSVALVAISAVAVGLVVHAIWPTVGLALAIALGAVVAPPDAVAATALGKQLGLPPRVLTILEGEGLVNDATALVLLSTALSAAAGAGQGVSVWGAVGAFAWAVTGAVLVGGLVGLLVVQVRRALVDPVLDAALSVATPFIAFLPAEAVGGSGVVAVVVAGLVVGNRGQSRIRAAHRLTEASTWNTFTMIVENGVFLTMGLQLPGVIAAVDARNLHIVEVVGVGALVAVLLVVVRYAVLPPLLLTLRRVARERARRYAAMGERLEAITEVPPGREGRLERIRAAYRRKQNDLSALRDQALGWRDTAVIGWAGMRGVVTVAAVQTLPREHPYYTELVLVAFTVATLTLLVQGGTLPLLVRVLHLQRDTRARDREEMLEVISEMTDVGVQAITEAATDRDADPHAVELAIRRTTARRPWFAHAVEVDPDDPDNDVAQFVDLRRSALAAQRVWLAETRREGRHSSDSIARAQRLVDHDEVALAAESEER
ncbi:cation:proton antiporter [Cumulibacter manganitolerans]|uniref:cation:proton antiporter n=1 Tax=Cumulibacter manganitolerans TaxID=1884992 RepID=UPI0012981609|nr:cation:proton antiporter [Cumulibacter manganitolerans]